MIITLLANKYATDAQPVTRTWGELLASFAKPDIRAAKDGPLFSPAVFDPPRRAKANARELSLLVLDYDSGLPIAEGLSPWRALGLRCAYYTTHSHMRATPDHPPVIPRYRVVIALTEPIPATLFPALWRWAANQSGGAFDPACKDASRIYYMPAKASDAAPYEWEAFEGEPLNWRALDLADAEPAPTRVKPGAKASLNGAREAAYAQAALSDEVARVRCAIDGNRNNQLNQSAFALGQLVGAGALSASEGEYALLGAAIGAGLAEAEARRTIQSGMSSGEREPRTLPDRAPRNGAGATSSRPAQDTTKQPIEADEQEEWEAPAGFDEYDLPEFPVDALPAWWRSFVMGLARETQTPVDVTAMLSLAACASAVAGNVEIQARRGWREPLNLFAVVALPPGNRKSAVFSSVTQPLESVEASLIADMRAEVARAESEHRTLAARVDHLEKMAAKTEDEEERRARQREAVQAAQDLCSMSVPKTPRLLADDATPETLATLLHDQGGRIALFSPEGDLFDIMGGRYSSGAPNLGVFLKGHAGDDLRVDRRGRSEYVRRPALTIGLAVQPDVLQGLVSKPAFKGRGLLGRFLYALPKSTLGARKTRVAPLDEEARAEYARHVKAMAGLSAGFDEDGARAPRMLYLSPDADDYLAAFQDEIEPQLAETAELGALSDWAAKLAGAALRIAGILHLAEHAGRFQNWPEKVGANTMKQAIEIGRYLIPHAHAAYTEMGADPEIEAAKYLLKWLSRWVEDSGEYLFRKQDAWQGTKGRFKRAADLDKAIALLMEQNFLRPVVEDTQKRRGRRPGGIYEINPQIASYNSYKSYKSGEKGISRNCRNSRNEDQKAIFKTSPPVDHPPMESDTREVITI